MSDVATQPGSSGQARDLSDRLEDMIRWLLVSPLRNTEPAAWGYGSLNHGVDPETGNTRGQYTEITGYGISLWAHLYRRHGEERFLQAAQAAAAFLLSIQTASGAYPDCPQARFQDTGRLYTFDTAMCLAGLLNLYRIDPQHAYLESACRAGRWLVSMQQEDGAFYAAFDPEHGLVDPGGFFGPGSCIHVKNAMGLLELATLSGDASFREAALRSCAYTLGLQADEGCFWAMPSRDFVFTHAHCYACEGLLFASVHMPDQPFRRAAVRGTEWLRKRQNADGSLFQYYHDRRRWKNRMRRLVQAHRVSDATGQAARLFALFGKEYEEPYRNAIRFVTTRMMSPHGGLYYTRGRLRMNRMLFAWPTMFAIEAIEFGRGAAAADALF